MPRVIPSRSATPVEQTVDIYSLQRIQRHERFYKHWMQKHRAAIGVAQISSVWLGAHRSLHTVWKMTRRTWRRQGSSSSSRSVKKLNDLLHYGSVPTSELRQKRSIRQRNETIHEIVEAASFGDVKCKHAVSSLGLIFLKAISSPSSNMVFIHMLAL